MELIVKNLTKRYGELYAINDFSIELKPGIYGLLGPNGSGKTTLLRILVGNLEASSGNVYFDGKDIQGLGGLYREKVGYMPQESGLYREFTVLRFMQYIAVLRDVNKKNVMEVIRDKLSLVNMWEHRYKKMPELSGGMRQRVMLAQAILADPEVLILDEPTAGVDPRERVQIRNIISNIGKSKIVLISTHITTDIAAMADRILVLRQGKLIANATREEMLSTISGKVGPLGETFAPDLEDYYLSIFPDENGV